MGRYGCTEGKEGTDLASEPDTADNGVRSIGQLDHALRWDNGLREFDGQQLAVPSRWDSFVEPKNGNAWQFRITPRDLDYPTSRIRREEIILMLIGRV